MQNLLQNALRNSTSDLLLLKKPPSERRYAKMVEDYIEDGFTAELEKLTRTEGQILIKLIHRQTGDTV
jgi:hypothetical protein